MQSADKELNVLPQRWSNGSLTGVRGRGDGTIDITWTQNHLAKLSLSAERAIPRTLRSSIDRR